MAAPWTGYMGGGGGPSGGVDRFTPMFLVGNVMNGDDPNPYSFGGFTYIPDFGNCAGLNTALMLAAGFDNATVDYRPGPYNMNLVGAPAGPMVIPRGCKLTGPGIALPPGGGFPLGPIIGRTSGDQGVFVCAGDGWAIRDTLVASFTDPMAAFAGSTEFVRVNGAGQFKNVALLVVGDNPASVMRTVVGIDSGGPVEVDTMYTQSPTFGFGSAVPADWGRVFRIYGNTKDFVSLRNIAAAGDVIVQLDASVSSFQIGNLQGLGCIRRGIWQTVPGHIGVSGDCAFFAGSQECLGAELLTDGAPTGSEIAHCRFYGTGPNQATGPMTFPAVRVRGQVGGGGGRVKIQSNTIAWQRQNQQTPLGCSVIELGTIFGDTVDRCSVEGNIIVNLTGGGVEVASAACNKNIIGGGSMELDPIAFPAATNLGTATMFYPISV